MMFMVGMYFATLVMMPFSAYHQDTLALHINLASGLACALFIGIRARPKEKKVE